MADDKQAPEKRAARQEGVGKTNTHQEQFPPAKLEDDSDKRTDQEKAAAGNPKPTEEQQAAADGGKDEGQE